MLGSAMSNKAVTAYCSPWHCDQHGLCVMPRAYSCYEPFSDPPIFLIPQQLLTARIVCGNLINYW